MASTVAVMRHCLALVLFLMSLCATPGQLRPSSSPRADFPTTDGPVHAILETNGVVYIGGEFSSVALRETRTASMDVVNGISDPGFPYIEGVVHAAAPDGQGGWYLGGRFTIVGGEPRTNLARVLKNNVVDPLWNPSADDVVNSIVLRAGLVYAGGQFTNIAGQARRNLAALDATTGVATTWNPTVCCDESSDSRSQVMELTASGGRLFVGGSFSRIGGRFRNHLAAFVMDGGTQIPWPEAIAEIGGFVSSLRVDGGTLLVGGRFQSMGGETRFNLAALDISNGAARSWNPGVSGDVLALELRGRTLFVGGDFIFTDGQLRSRLAAFDVDSGFLLDWDPAANGTVQRLSISGSTLYIGGDFSNIAGQERNSLAALNIDSGAALNWNPNATGRSVQSLMVSGSRVFASSQLPSSAQPRSRLAALEANTGRILDWSPGADSSVLTLAYANNTVFAGGEFLLISGVPRSRIAGIDATTGEVSPWGNEVAGPNARVVALAVGSNQVFAAGGFTSIGPFFSPGLAAFDLATGNSSTWRPTPNRTVLAIDVFADTVYAAGNFTSFGLTARRAFAALDAFDPVATEWNADMRGSGTIGWAIVHAGNTIYAGGSFTNVAGQSRRHLVALDPATAEATPWDPRLNSPGDLVQKLSVTDDAVYVAGAFSNIGGQPRRSLAALDRTSADALEWNPDPRSPSGNTPVSTVVAGANAIYVGGTFTSLGGQLHRHFAAFAPIGQPVFISHPIGGLLRRGQSHTLSGAVSGEPPIDYQWQVNGVNIPGATSPELILNDVQAARSGSYTLLASNALGLSTSSRALITVAEPLLITRQPLSTTAQPGNQATFSITAIGIPAPQFQWKLNGVVIPGQNFSTLKLEEVQASEAGTYSVTVYNGFETIESSRASLSVAGSFTMSADAFDSRTVLTGVSGSTIGHNGGATFEFAEPIHAGRPGGRSIWYSWTAPASGIATFSTRGSGFDTLLAVYTNATASDSNLIVGDDDQGGFLTSKVSFNAVAGLEYQVAVDGYAGANGRVVLSWNLDATSEQLPRIAVHPKSQTVVAGAAVRLDVSASGGTARSYQWLRNGRTIRGATNAALAFPNFQPAQVGNYSVLVREGTRELDSLPASIEVGPSPAVASQDKFQDLFLGELTSLIQLDLGTVGTQFFHNNDATTQSLEPNHGGAPGGGSKWFRFRASTNALVQFDTIGSEIDTTLSVYAGTNLSTLSVVASDNDGAPDAARSLVSLTTVAGVEYLVAVDGFNGARGILQLNWHLGFAPVIVPAFVNPVVRLGESLSLSAGTGGTFPSPSHQWRLGGNVIAGATNSTLALSDFQATQAGNYSVVVSNFAGVVTNNVASISFIAPVLIQYASVSIGGQPAVHLHGPVTNELVLEASVDFENWVPLQTYRSIEPLDIIESASGEFSRRFYRGLITPAAGIRTSWITNDGQSLLLLSGPINQVLIIEKTSDLSTWQPLWTNTLVVPFNYIDFDSTNFPTRFYRLR